MNSDQNLEVALRRGVMLATALGSSITTALQDPRVMEVMVNADGALWLDVAGHGRLSTGHRLSADQAERIIRLVASQSGRETLDRAIVSAELPMHDAGGGERFEGLLPPVVAAPSFCIRKPVSASVSLDDYVQRGVISAAQSAALVEAVGQRRNILVAGATSSGKTTLVNALLAEIARVGDRILILEDTRELRCAAPDHLALRTQPGRVSMRDLLRSTLRLRPDRIVVGEVRGGEALDLLKAWNTGHPGGVATLHANSALAALHRLESLVQEAAPIAARSLIAQAIDLIVFLQGRDGARRLEAIVEVRPLGPDGEFCIEPLFPQNPQ